MPQYHLLSQVHIRVTPIELPHEQKCKEKILLSLLFGSTAPPKGAYAYSWVTHKLCSGLHCLCEAAPLQPHAVETSILGSMSPCPQSTERQRSATQRPYKKQIIQSNEGQLTQERCHVTESVTSAALGCI